MHLKQMKEVNPLSTNLSLYHFFLLQCLFIHYNKIFHHNHYFKMFENCFNSEKYKE